MIVEDESIVRTLLSAQFDRAGYQVDAVGSCSEMFDRLSGSLPDLIVLDLGLPDEDGLVALRQIRSKFTFPVLVLTSRNEPQASVAALEIGADDYVSKSVLPEEIVLRVRNVLRRGSRTTGAADDGAQEDVITFSGWQLHVGRRVLKAPDANEVRLTRGEFDILLTLARADGRVLSRDQLMDGLQYLDEPPNDRMIDTFVSRIRAKMKSPRHIATVTGIGYRFVPEPD